MAFERVGLGLAAAFGHRFGEVGEQHGEPQPEADAGDEPGRFAAAGDQPLEQKQRRDDAADEHGEHHRVADLVPRIELDEARRRQPAARSADRTADELWQVDMSFVLEFGCSRLSRRFTSCNHLQVFDNRSQRQRRDERQRADEHHRRSTSSTTNSGVCVGSVPAPGGVIFLLRQRAGDRQHRESISQ